MRERERNGVEPPPTIAAALSACDVFIAPTRRSLSHTEARRAACARGARGATLPGATPELLARLLRTDIDTLRRRTAAIAALLDGGTQARITCEQGTDLTLDFAGRPGLSDAGELASPGAFGNLPFGEACVAPRGGHGTLAGSTLAGFGLSQPAPTLLTVEDGHLVAGDGPHGEPFLAQLAAHGADGTAVAELGVGTNDAATLTGVIVEDEKLLGSIHVAFGASSGIGGTVSVPIHLDVVVIEPTLHVDGTCVLDRGAWVLPDLED
jgi:leucyl aminopeptidase (aminopeptidase T)